MIRILDVLSNKTMFFDRVKTAYGGFRIITTSLLLLAENSIILKLPLNQMPK